MHARRFTLSTITLLLVGVLSAALWPEAGSLPLRAQQLAETSDQPAATGDWALPSQLASDYAWQGDQASAHDPDALERCGDLRPWLMRDRATLCELALKAVEHFPGDHESWLLYLRAREAFSELGRERELFETLRHVSAADRPDATLQLNRFGEQAREWTGELAHLAERFGDPKFRHRCMSALCGLQAFHITGPFLPDGEDALLTPLAPDAAVRFDRSMQAPAWDLQWQPWQANALWEDRVDLLELTPREGSGVYLLCELVVESRATINAQLEVFDLRGGMIAWLNGRQIAKRMSWQDQQDEWAAPVQLAPGTHSLLVKLGNDARAGVRVVDPVSRLRLPMVSSRLIEQSKRFTLVPHHPKPGSAQDLRGAPPASFAERFVRRARLAIAQAPQRGWKRARVAAAISAYLLKRDDQPERAEDWLHFATNHAAADGEPLDDLASHAWSLRYASLGRDLLNGSQHTKRLRDALAFLQELLPDAPQLVQEQLEVAEDQGELEAVADGLLRLIELDPHWSTRRLAARTFQRMGWTPQARDQRAWAWESTGEDAATLELLLDRISDLKSAGNFQRAWQLCQHPRVDQAAMSWRVLNLRMSLAQRLNLRDVGRELIEQMRRREGGDTQWMRSFSARQQAWLGDWQAGYDAWLAMAQPLNAFSARYMQDAADLALEMGDLDRARAAYRLLLKDFPGEIDGRRTLAELAGNAPTLLPPLATRVEDMDASAFKAEDFPLAPGGVLLDEAVLIVNADGSYSEYVQRAVKVFTQAGVDRFGSDRAEGELLAVRTMLPDGTSYEPVSYSGSRVQYPRVAPDALLHRATVDHFRREAAGKQPRYGFIFGEYDSRLPTALARLVVITPADMRINWYGHGFSDEGFERRELEDGRHAHIWEVRNPRSLPRERYAPEAEEVRPWIKFSRTPNPRDTQRAMLLDDYRPLISTHLLRKALAAIYLQAWRAATGTAIDEAPSLADLQSAEVRFQGDGPSFAQQLSIHQTPVFPEGTYLGWNAAAREALGDRTCAELIYAWIAESIDDQSRGTSPHSTLMLRSGDRHELLHAMLVAAGIDAPTLAMASADSDVGLDEVFSDDDFFRERDLLRITGADGTPHYLSLDDRHTPFGWLDHAFSGREVCWVDPISGAMQRERLPLVPADHFGEAFELDLLLSADGNAQAQGVYAWRGSSGWGRIEPYRNQRAEEQHQDFENELSYMLSGFTLDASEQLDWAKAPGFARSFQGSAQGIARSDGASALSISLPITEAAYYIGEMAEEDERAQDLVISSPVSVSDRVRFTPPKGYAFDELPESLSFSHGPVRYALTWSLEEGALVMQRELSVRPGRVERSAYPAFRERLLAIQEAEDRDLRLTLLAPQE